MNKVVGRHICWCGNESLRPFSDSYLRCDVCDSLVLKTMPRSDLAHVEADKGELYSEDYYLRHLPDTYGYPDLVSRARTDLPERCLHWLKTLLKYKLPPAKTLELGSAHGGFVAMLQWAGFEAAGLELSPSIVSYTKNTFKVKTYLGPVEDQTIKRSSLDVIAMMDVLEHFQDPVSTVKHCLKLLKPDRAPPYSNTLFAGTCQLRTIE